MRQDPHVTSYYDGNLNYYSFDSNSWFMPFLHFVMVMYSFKFQHAPEDLSHDDNRMTNRRLKEEARSGGRRGARQGRDAGENKVGHE